VRLFLEEDASGKHASQSVIYFRVADIHAAHRSLQARGAQFTKPRT